MCNVTYFQGLVKVTIKTTSHVYKTYFTW